MGFPVKRRCGWKQIDGFKASFMAPNIPNGTGLGEKGGKANIKACLQG